MAITAASFTPDPRTGQMLPIPSAATNVDLNDSPSAGGAIAVPPPAMTTGAGRGRVTIKKAR